MNDLFDSIYRGIKQGQANLILTIYLFEFFLIKEPVRAVALMFKYNFLFLILENLHIPKC